MLTHGLRRVGGVSRKGQVYLNDSACKKKEQGYLYLLGMYFKGDTEVCWQ